MRSRARYGLTFVAVLCACTAACPSEESGGGNNTDDTGSDVGELLDTGSSVDSPTDSESVESGDTASTETTPVDAGGDSPVVADGGPPSVTISAPTEGGSISFNLMSDACQGGTFTASFNAPAGFATMKWTFFLPSSGTGASCGVGAGGAPKAAYGYFMDPATYGGTTSGTLTENVAIAGLYEPTKRWWWCTPPTAPNGVVSMPPAPAVSLNTLSNYCYSRTNGATPTNPAEQWTLQVVLVDKAGNSVTASRKFWIHN